MVGFLLLAATIGATPTAAYSEQGSVGSWPLRIGLTLGVLLAVLLVLAGFRRGWRRRKEAQAGSGVGAFPTNPGDALSDPGSRQDAFRAKYIGTARADDLFTRIISGGGPAQVRFIVSDSGIDVYRQGDDPLLIFADSIMCAGSGKGMLQKAYARHGLLLVTWRWDDQEVTSGFWLAQKEEQLRALAAIERVASAPPTASAATGHSATQGGQK